MLLLRHRIKLCQCSAGYGEGQLRLLQQVEVGLRDQRHQDIFVELTLLRLLRNAAIN